MIALVRKGDLVNLAKIVGDWRELDMVLVCSSALLVLLCLLSGSNGADVVQSKIISAVSDGAGWFKIVNGVPRGALLKANFTNKINTTGSVINFDTNKVQAASIAAQIACHAFCQRLLVLLPSPLYQKETTSCVERHNKPSD